MLRGWLGGEAGGEEAGLEHGRGRSGGKRCVGENQDGTGDS